MTALDRSLPDPHPDGQMNAQQQEPPQAPFQLRSGLRLHTQEGNTSLPYTVLEDPGQNKYFRLGPGETGFIRALLAGQSLSQAAQASTHTEFGCLSEEMVQQLCGWLAQNKLVCNEATQGAPSEPPASAPRPSALAQFFSKIYFTRIPLLDPDDLLNRMHRGMGWMFAWQFTVLGLIVAFVGLMLGVSNSEEFLESYNQLFTSWRSLWLIVTWFGLKLIHETAHAMTCKRYGGEVPEAGLAMIVLMPIAYVDVTSCWRFPSRWQRFHVTMAGVAAEFFVAGLAMIAWYLTDALPIKNAAADMVLMASLTTVLFNLNPLLKFDGYFALADATGVDNLYQLSQSYARYFGGRYLFGLEIPPPKLPESHSGWIKVYAVSAACYRVLTVSGLVIAAAALFQGAGIAVAIAGLFTFAIQPAGKLFAYLRGLYCEGNLYLSRLFLRCGSLFACSALALFLIPADMHRTSPGIVEYDPPSVLRAPASGFITHVFVQDGEQVVAGQPLLEIQNDDLVLQLATLKTKLAQVQQQSRSARWTKDSSLLVEAESEAAGLREQIAELQNQFDSLVMRAECDGRVVSRQLPILLGTYVEVGSELGAIGKEDSKRLKVSLSDWAASRSDQWSESPLLVSVGGMWAWEASLSHVETRASDTPPDPSLTATGGGRLAVVQDSDSQDFVLCEPRVNAFVTLEPDRARSVRCGQRCYVRLSCWRQSLGSLLWQYLRQTIG